MADIDLKPAMLDDIKNALMKAEQDMVDAVNTAFTALNNVKENMDGFTNEAWGQWQADFQRRYDRLLGDYDSGIKALDQMANIIIEADQQGRHYFPR
jgi:uncharacterized protein YutD